MLGALISAGAGLLGNVLSGNRQERLQKEFAQNQLTWKAADAERAGISKIFAMGAPTHSYSPVSTGDYGLGAAGKAVGDAIEGQGGAGGTTSGKTGGLTHAIASAQLDGLKIDNDIKRAELASKIRIATQPGAGGMLEPFPGPDGIRPEQKIVPADPTQTQRAYGVNPEVFLDKTATGWAPRPSQELAEVHENNAYMRWQWNMRNLIAPFMYDQYKSNPGEAPKGSIWVFNPATGQYTLERKTPFHRGYEDWWARRSRQEQTR